MNNKIISIPAKISKYNLASQSLAVGVGMIGISQSTDATITALNLPGTIENVDFVENDSPSQFVVYNLALSTTDTTDVFNFIGQGNYVGITGGDGTTIKLATNSNINYDPKLFNIGDSINVTSNAANGYNVENLFYNVISYGNSERAPWTSDQTNVAIGFVSGDNQPGYFLINWVVATETMTVLGGFIETSGSSITVAAVPEPSEYAAALGLGATGLAYYRKLKSRKNRP